MINYKKHLQQNILPFWLKNALDRVNGGIYTSLDREGKIYDTTKSGWFQGRSLWTFSKAYNLVEKRPEYLEAAKLIYSFLPKIIDSDGRMFFSVTAEGKGVQKRRYWFSESFAAIGLAEYYKATGDMSAFLLADKLFDNIVNLYEHPENPKYNPETVKLKSHSPVMILMNVAQIMRSVGINAKKYDAVAGKMAHELLTGGFINDEVHALLESPSLDGSLCDTTMGRHINPGHALETAWFLMAEGDITGNDELIKAGFKIVDISMPIGYDKKHGGLIQFADAKGYPATPLEWDMKLWWPQCEAIIANLYAYKISGDEKYKKAYDELAEYTFSHFPDEEYGEWFGYLHYDGTVSHTLKGNLFKGPFHIPRMLMTLHCLEEDGNLIRYFK